MSLIRVGIDVVCDNCKSRRFATTKSTGSGARGEAERHGWLVAHLAGGMHRPSAATTLEVNRTCVTDAPNANSMLYGACARAAFALGYRRLITYTEAGESGASLRAAGWRVIAERKPRPGWDMPSRRREAHGNDHVQRFLWESS